MLLALPREMIEDLERDIHEHSGNIDYAIKVEVLNYFQKCLNLELNSNHDLLDKIIKIIHKYTNTHNTSLSFLSFDSFLEHFKLEKDVPISQVLLKTKEMLEDADELVLDFAIEEVLKECIFPTTSDNGRHSSSSQQQNQQCEEDAKNVQFTKHKENTNYVQVRQKVIFSLVCVLFRVPFLNTWFIGDPISNEQSNIKVCFD
jgi:ATP-dependent Clp protease ATP-binding subunit ClpA